MANVFVSHSNADSQASSWLAEALERRGLSVWIDEKLAGQSLNDEIRAQIREANAVVILLSEHSVTSQWVLGETELAADKAVGVRLDRFDVRDKAPVRLLGGHIIDLSDWDGDDRNPHFEKVAARCAELSKIVLRPVPPTGPRASRDNEGKVLQVIDNRGKIGAIATVISGPINQEF